VPHRLTPGLALLRSAGFAALLLLLWNPTTARWEAVDAPPLVLLDASLSMGATGGRWHEALDTARALARGGGVVWRFGTDARAYDSLPPRDGASRLAPALAAAAGRGGPVIVVTDGAIADRGDVPVDLLRRTRVVVLPRPPFFDAFVASVEGPRRVSAGDTIRLSVSYGTAGPRGPGPGPRLTTLAVSLQGRRLVSRSVELPDSGIVSTDLSFPVSRFPSGWAVVDVRLEGVGDEEPRDDARLFVVEVSPQPSVVLLAAPPDWDTRFLARTLGEVARVPVRVFVAAEAGPSRWRDAATLGPVSSATVGQAVGAARLVVRAGDAARFAGLTPKGAVLSWLTVRGQEGDWYVQPPGPSPLAGALAGIAWDSLPPAVSLADVPADSLAVVILAARLARRGVPRPVILLTERDSARRATIAATGLYRWAFRGGASAEAYRALVAALADWLLAEGGGSRDRFRPVTYEVPNGMPVTWRWTAAGAPKDVVVRLAGPDGDRRDTLRFDATGGAVLSLAPGAYRYSAADGAERGLVAVDTYSDEWRPAAPELRPQDGAPAGRLASTAMRDRWWLFVVAIAAFAAEWAWRRRQGLP
jgi:hypothetical protein